MLKKNTAGAPCCECDKSSSSEPSLSLSESSSKSSSSVPFFCKCPNDKDLFIVKGVLTEISGLQDIVAECGYDFLWVTNNNCFRYQSDAYVSNDQTSKYNGTYAWSLLHHDNGNTRDATEEELEALLALTPEDESDCDVFQTPFTNLYWAAPAYNWVQLGFTGLVENNSERRGIACPTDFTQNTTGTLLDYSNTTLRLFGTILALPQYNPVTSPINFAGWAAPDANTGCVFDLTAEALSKIGLVESPFIAIPALSCNATQLEVSQTISNCLGTTPSGAKDPNHEYTETDANGNSTDYYGNHTTQSGTFKIRLIL
jgi:hypothetical protein